jgi:hypothetical protein
MAVASYTHDLTTFYAATSLTGFGELAGYTAGSKESIDPDLAIYGTVCLTASNRSAAPCSLAFTGTGPTLPTNGVFFVWQKFFAPNSLNTEANGGIIVGIGSTINNYYKWTLDGSDSYPYGGWLNYAVDPLITANRTTVGTPSGVHNTIGVGWDMINGISKGNALNLDIIRYGRGESRFTGGDLANGYATFLGYSIINDNPTTGRFGLIQAISGGYLYKGLMSLGFSGTAVDFRDSNTNISVDNTKHVSSAFNRIEVHNVGSRVDLTNVSFASLGIVSAGEFEMIDNADVNILATSFNNMSTFVFLSNADVISSTFNGCNNINTGGGVFTNTKVLAVPRSMARSLENTPQTASKIFHIVRLSSALSG